MTDNVDFATEIDEMRANRACTNENCLLSGTPPVGIFPLSPNKEGILHKVDEGQTFKLGKGRATRGALKAVRTLAQRELPKVREIGIGLDQISEYQYRVVWSRFRYNYD